eukprot:m.337709 g.337709  ORF g.337709 m.337709 type:complete len:142 (-) comp18213_c1_seq1:866-1291(-)
MAKDKDKEAGNKSKDDKSAAVLELKLKAALEKEHELQEQLEDLEADIYKVEDKYLTDTQAWGHIFRGWEGYTSTKSNTGDRRVRKFKDSERLFSLSSCTTSQESLGDDAMRDKRKRKKYKHKLGKKIRTEHHMMSSDQMSS